MATYISLDNLVRYDLKAKARAEGLYADASAACWQKTESVKVPKFCPAPDTPLEPIVEFGFKETPPASDEKSPSNPSSISGVDSVLVGVTGKNVQVLQLSRASLGNFSFQTYSDGSFRITGTALASSVEELVNLMPRGKYYPSFVPGEKYTASFYSDNNKLFFQAYCRNLSGSYTGLLPHNMQSGESCTFTVPDYQDAAHDLWLRIKIQNNSTEMAVDSVCKIQIEHGEQATEFVPAPTRFYESEIQLGDTYYGGTLDVASGKLTVTWKGYVFDGTENWLGNSNNGTYYRYSLPIVPNKNTTDIACTHFVRANNLNYDTQHYIIFNGGISIFTTQTTLEDFKAWLVAQYANGTPVTACYALETPYTVQISPTPIDSLPALDKTSPRINTIYTDADSVQVGYAEHPAYTEELINNAILALGGNI